jgi:ketosteroid isomerase-like protein
MSTFHATAEDAAEAFYEAIARADLDTLMELWADDEDIVCIHPTGLRVEGHAAIRESWRAIFASNPRFSMHIRGKVRWESATISVHSLVETLYLQDDRAMHGTMQTTHVFIRGPGGWRLLSRHTSATLQPEGGKDAGVGRKHTLH